MKKIAVILLLICYIIPAFGMTIVTHYCGGKLTSISLKLSGQKCLCSNKKMKKDCCKTKTCSIQFKIDQQQTLQVEVDFSKAISFQSAIIHTDISTLFSVLVAKGIYPHHKTPLQIKQPLYLLNRVLRI